MKESAKIAALHIISLVCPTSSKGVAFCLRNFTEIAEAICAPSQITNVYALSASNRGEALLRNNGFTRIRSAVERSDGHPYYSVKYADLTNNPRLHKLHNE